MTAFVLYAMALLTSVSALAALACWRALSKVTATVGKSYVRVELAEIRDELTKQATLLKRINARDTMRERRAEENDAEPRKRVANITDKNELRRIAGLIPGRPAPHRE